MEGTNGTPGSNRLGERLNHVSKKLRLGRGLEEWPVIEEITRWMSWNWRDGQEYGLRERGQMKEMKLERWSGVRTVGKEVRWKRWNWRDGQEYGLRERGQVKEMKLERWSGVRTERKRSGERAETGEMVRSTDWEKEVRWKSWNWRDGQEYGLRERGQVKEMKLERWSGVRTEGKRSGERAETGEMVRSTDWGKEVRWKSWNWRDGQEYGLRERGQVKELKLERWSGVRTERKRSGERAETGEMVRSTDWEKEVRWKSWNWRDGQEYGLRERGQVKELKLERWSGVRTEGKRSGERDETGEMVRSTDWGKEVRWKSWNWRDGQEYGLRERGQVKELKLERWSGVRTEGKRSGERAETGEMVRSTDWGKEVRWKRWNWRDGQEYGLRERGQVKELKLERWSDVRTVGKQVRWKRWNWREDNWNKLWLGRWSGKWTEIIDMIMQVNEP